jgi:hypothetical protein
MNTKTFLIVGTAIALTLLSIAMTIGTLDHTVFANKGEAAFHISEQGAEHQASQGAANSGVKPPCTICT